MADRMMTYEEAATALGRSPEAVRQLCKRKHFRRTLGNDGKARVAIPEEMIAEASGRLAPERHPADQPADHRMTPSRPPADLDGLAALHFDQPVTPVGPSEDARALIAHLEARVSDLGTRAVRLENEVEILRPRAAHADVLTAQLEAERQRIAEMIMRANEMRAERDRLLDRALEQPIPSPITGILTRLRQVLSGK